MGKRDFSNRNDFKKRKKNKNGIKRDYTEELLEFNSVKIKGRSRGKEKVHKMRDYNE